MRNFYLHLVYKLVLYKYLNEEYVNVCHKQFMKQKMYIRHLVFSL